MPTDGISAADGERTKTSVGRRFLAAHVSTWGAEWKEQGERAKDYKISASFGVTCRRIPARHSGPGV